MEPAGQTDPTLRIRDPLALRVLAGSSSIAAAIPGYTILEKIGEGGMGMVYKARQATMDRIVALKVLHPHVAAEEGGHERFLREARAIAKLSHPNVVAGIDAGEVHGLCYLVMEYLQGESMDAVLRRRGRLPWREAVGIAREMALALEHAQQNGMVHRDIKPGNIIQLADGTSKLTDLGLARLAGSGDLTLTQSGAIVGSPCFLSPEQAQGLREIDIRSDIYSLGLTLFEFLAGERAYQGTNPMAVINARLTRDLPLGPLETAAVPRDVIAVTAMMTRRDVERRYQEPRALVEDLDAVLRGVRPVHAGGPRRRQGALAAVGALVAAAALLLAAQSWTGAAPLVGEPTPPFVKMAQESRLTFFAAIERARAEAGEGTVYHVELEAAYKTIAYSVDFSRGGEVCNVIIDAIDGHLIERKVDKEDHRAQIEACRTPLVTAVEAALRAHPGVAVEADLVQPGNGVILVKIVVGDRVVSVSVDAATGVVRPEGSAP